MSNSKLSKLKDLCSNSSVKAKDLAPYCRSKFHGSGVDPEAVVWPESIPEVVALVKWARETNTPLVPVSSTGDHYNGGSNPSAPAL